MAKKKIASKAKPAKSHEGMSHEHMKEYAHMSPAQLKKHMKEEVVLLKKKLKKK